MSGICGLVRWDGRAAGARDLERQMRALSHLGPDRARGWNDGAAALGALLMRTTREDAYDRQPLQDAQAGLTLVGAARLDNRETLAGLLGLEEAELADAADSALLLAAFRRWGENCVDHLLGDFVFAVWDARARRLTLVRDHMGQRQLFYHWGEGFLAFASEVKGLWALPEVPRRLLEERYVRRRLFDALADPDATHFEGILGLPGGTVLTLDAEGALALRRYWEPHADPAHLGRDETYYVETYRKVLGEAVTCRLRRSTAPVGLLLSGGFDSASIAALAGAAVSANGQKLIAASSVMPEGYTGSIHHPRKWVEICRRDMAHLDVRYVTREGRDFFSGMDRSFLLRDGGHSPNRCTTEALYDAVAGAGARIVMDGFGGDYTLNPRAQNALARLLAMGRLREFVNEFRAARRHTGKSMLRLFVGDVLYRLMPRSWLGARNRLGLGVPLFGPIVPVSRRILEARGRNPQPRFAMRSVVDMRSGALQILKVIQNNPAMAGAVFAASHGLLQTQPFHDKRVVELGLAIPEDLYFRDGKARYMALRALADLLPPEYQTRKPWVTEVMTPDMLQMARESETRLLAEIDRMERAGYLSRYFDFPRMRRMLTRRPIDRHASGLEFEVYASLGAFSMARFIEWFRGDNADAPIPDGEEAEPAKQAAGR